MREFGTGKSTTSGTPAWFIQVGAFTSAETLAYAVLILFGSHGFGERIPPFEIRRVYEDEMELRLHLIDHLEVKWRAAFPGLTQRPLAEYKPFDDIQLAGSTIASARS